MKNWMTWTCVALALCFVVSMTYAQEKGKDRPKTDSLRVSGKVKSVDTTANTLVVTVKKEEVESDMTFTVVTEGEGATKISIGRDAKPLALAEVTVGANVMVAYKTTGEVNTALMIRVMTGEGGKKREGDRK